MKLLSFVFLILSLGVIAEAQDNGVIIGTVRFNGAPVAGVTVTATLKDYKISSLTVSTNSAGEYRFTRMAPGEYTIGAAVTVGGILRQNAPVNPITVSDGEALTRDLVLRDPVNEQVTVSADSPQPLEQVSKTIDLISGQEMRDRADFSLVEALRSIPGFRVQQLGGFGRTATIKTRGLRNQDTALLIDGIRFRDASSITGDASAFLSDFTLTSVNRIEILRGSGSSLYGTNAIGGTVDFQTPRPRPSFHGQLSTAVGELGLKRFRANVSDGTDNAKIGYTLGISRTAYTEGIDKDDNAHNTNFQSRVEYAPTSRTNLSGRVFVSDAYVRLNVSPDTINPRASNFGEIRAVPGGNFTFDADDPDSTQLSKFFSGQIVLTQVLNNKLHLQASYSGLKTSRKNDDGILGPGFQSPYTSFFDGTINTANTKLTWTPSETNQIAAGYEFEREKFGNDGETPDGTGNFFTRASQSSHTFYAQDLIQLLNKKLSVSGGVRAQFFGINDPTFSVSNAPYSGLTIDRPSAAYTFDGSVSYFFAGGTKLRAHVGNGYRVPSLYERFGTFFSSFGVRSFIALGDPNLKPERTLAFDAGIEQNLFRGRARLSATYFYTKLDRTIGYGNVVPDIGTTPRPFGGYLNSPGGIARGAEISAKLKPTEATDIFATYTFTNSDQNSPQVAGSGILQTLGIPKNQFTFVATQRLERLWLNVDVLITDSYLAPIFSGSTFQSYVYRFKGNRRADATAGYTFALGGERLSLRLFGTVENVFDYEYYENGFRTAGRNARIGLSFGF